MRSYSYAKMIVDGKATKELEIFREVNTFHVYEHDINVFTGSFFGTIDFIEEWKAKAEPLKNFLEASGHKVTFEQTIK